MESDNEPVSNSVSASTDIVLNSVENKNNDHPFWITCYMNGNPYLAGEKILYSKKRFKTDDAFYDEITRRLHCVTGVRALGTPKRGSRVHSLLDLEEGQRYVALANDTFKPLSYTDIQSTPRRRPPRNFLEIPKKNKKYQDVPGKIPQCNIQATKIFVWPNKERIDRPHPITLQPFQLQDMGQVIKQVDDRIGIRCGECFDRLYSRHGYHIRDPKDLRHDECYVAVPRHQRFRKVPYKDLPMPNFWTSPHVYDRNQQLPPLNSSRGSKNSKQWSPDHSGHSSYPDSENSYSQRYRKSQNNRHSRERKEEDEVFPRKPVSHKRSSERKQHREVDLDKDSGGVFKSKQSNRHTQGAREVNDSRDTRVDLPIDQVPAEEVKEEEEQETYDDKTAPVPSGVELTKLPSEQNSEDTKNEDEEERIRRRPNNDRNTNNNQTPPKYKSKAKAGNKSTTPARMNGYSSRTPDGQNVTPSQEEDNNRRNSSQANRGRNSYDERRYSPPRRSPTPRRSPSPRYSPAQRRSPTPRRSPSPIRRNSRPRSSDRYSHGHSPDRNDDNLRQEEEAALAIQAHFRGYQVRKEMNRNDRYDNDDRGQDDFLRNEREAAATTIQSRYRGYRERKNYAQRRAMRVMSAGRRSAGSQRSRRSLNEDFRDPGRSDMEMAAATTIQAGYRGYRDRKMLRERRY